MSYRFAGIIDRYLLSGSEFTHRLRAVRAEQWTAPTPAQSGTYATSSTT